MKTFEKYILNTITAITVLLFMFSEWAKTRRVNKW